MIKFEDHNIIQQHVQGKTIQWVLTSPKLDSDFILIFILVKNVAKLNTD